MKDIKEAFRKFRQEEMRISTSTEEVFNAGYQAALSAVPAQDTKEKDISEAVTLLSAVFDAWENGTDCYDDFDGVSGSFIGKAFNLDDEIFKRCCSLLNRINPPRNVSQQPAQQPQVASTTTSKINNLGQESSCLVATCNVQDESCELCMSGGGKCLKQPEQEPVGEVQHYAAPANLPAYVNMKWYGKPPKNGTKLYTAPVKQESKNHVCNYLPSLFDDGATLVCSCGKWK